MSKPFVNVNEFLEFILMKLLFAKALHIEVFPVPYQLFFIAIISSVLGMI